MTKNQKPDNNERTRWSNGRPTIGFLNASGLQFFHMAWRGVADVAREHNINAISFVGQYVRDTKGFKTQANILYDLIDAEQLDGLVITNLMCNLLDAGEARQFYDRYRPLHIVSLGRLSMEGYPYVQSGGYKGMRQAIVHLIEVHNRRRIAFIKGLPNYRPHDERYQAYVDVLAEYDLPFDPARVAVPHDAAEEEQPDWGQVALRRLLDEQEAEFDALVTNDDQFAHDFLPELQARGIRVPDDIALVSFDDEEGSHCLTPPLTTVPIPIYEMGRQAAETLLAKLEGREVLNQAIDVPSDRLIVRQSCGCLDPKVTQVAAGPVERAETAEPLEVSLAGQRESIVAEMRGAAEKAVDGLDPDWAEQLLDGFVAALTTAEAGEASTHFLSTLDETLRQMLAAEGDIEVWPQVLSTLRRQVLPYLSIDQVGTSIRDRAEDLWLQAQMMIGEVGQRAQAYRDLQAEQRKRILNQIGTALATNFDLNDSADILARELPRLGISRGYLSLYEAPQSYQYPQPVPEYSRLVLAYDEQNPAGSSRVELEAGGRRFSSRQLVPPELLPQQGSYNLIVHALYFQNQQIGFMLLDGDQRDGDVYDMLRAQISSAQQGALLVEQEEKRGRQLQTVAEVSTASSTILDPIELLQTVVDLTRNKFGLYHAHIYLFNQANDTLVLKAGAGDVGRQMVEKGWSIPRFAEKSLVARAARTRKGEIVNDVQADPDWLANPLLPDTRSELAMPLIAGDRVLGVLDVQSSDPDHFSEEDIRIQTTLATQVAGAIENARLFGQAQTALEETAQAKDEAEKVREEVETINETLESQMWLISGQTLLSEKMRGGLDVSTLANQAVEQLCDYLQALVGTLYVVEDDTLKLAGSYANQPSVAQQATRLNLGEGLVGQVALKKKPVTLTDVPSDYYLTISSSLGRTVPKNILIFPFTLNDKVIGVFELGMLGDITPAHTEFLEAVVENIAIAFNTAQAQAKIEDLLGKTQQQAEELQAQSEELRVANEELEAQTESLKESETILKEKQTILDQQNKELKVAQHELEYKAEQLALTSKYKSEFLANMSHELRTPLNSLLILAGMLANNEEGNLTEDQVESTQVIRNSGQDLLTLINDILDLSKIEAGRMAFYFEPMSLDDLVGPVQAQFDHVAKEKGLDFNISLADNLPKTIVTDPQRLRQIIKNLLSNAFKFTEAGSVSLHIHRPGADDLSDSSLDSRRTIAVSVTDAGIGMTPEQQKIVFEAFQQAEGGTSRKYGGTGLGLSISRELIAKLGGEIQLESELGKGSTFTVYLPEEQGEVPSETMSPPAAVKWTPTAPIASTRPEVTSPPSTAKPASVSSATPTPPPIPDDRDNLEPDDKALLIIEDDPNFAKIVYNFAHKKGFKGLLAVDGETGLSMAQTYTPDAIVLDLNLPGINGWQVLDTLKENPDTRHISVHIMSVEDQSIEAFQRGAIDFLAKPASQEDLDTAFQKIAQFIDREIKTLLLVEDDENLRRSVKKLLSGNTIEINEAGKGQTALDLLKTQNFDCMILDLSLPDMSGFEVLQQMNEDEIIGACPVIVYTGKELTPQENAELMKYADSIIVKGVKSPDRLLDETALFLHQVVAKMPEEKQKTIRQLHDPRTVLAGKKVLLVDDDIRNSYALSKLLRDKGIVVEVATDGQHCLDVLAENPDFDLALMDVMMPVMDGYEATRRIRAQQQFRDLPILALTAKAMKGDREKCLEAGANDYLPKPIDAERLFSMLQVWLQK